MTQPTTKETTEPTAEPVELRSLPIEVAFAAPGKCRCGKSDTQFIDLNTGKRRCSKCATSSPFPCIRYH